MLTFILIKLDSSNITNCSCNSGLWNERGGAGLPDDVTLCTISRSFNYKSCFLASIYFEDNLVHCISTSFSIGVFFVPHNLLINFLYRIWILLQRRTTHFEILSLPESASALFPTVLLLFCLDKLQFLFRLLWLFAFPTFLLIKKFRCQLA